jgi:poly-gamma-glutamate capsule biosynthesis protein CapA/YwtB (metallophosphatase superfamily)
MRRGRWYGAAAGIVLAGLLPVIGRAGEPARSFTIAASGDILIHASVAQAAAAYAGGNGYDFTPMLGPTEPWISEADLAICHLEGALSADDSGLSYYPLFVAPHTVANAIAAAGYDACSLAGNHALDRGERGLEETIELLEERGIAHEGTARSEDERLPGLYQVNGVRVAHLDYTYGLNGLPRPAWYSVNLIDPEAILADARWAREQGAEFVILTIHWGVEYQHAPTVEQVVLAERLLGSADIDLIIGSHAHVVQPIGRVNGKVVVYGMGNHLSNQNSMWGPKYDSTEDGVIVYVTVTEQADGRFATASVEYTPTWVEMHSYQVLPAAWALAAGEGDPGLVTSSLARTTRYVTLLGTEGLAATPAAWPPLMCAGRLASLVGTAGSEVLVGTPRADVIAGRGGDDTIQGYGGNDLLCGGPGDDILWGGPGFDELHGEDGNDTLYGGIDRDVLWGENGDDSLWGEPGPDALFGGEGDDRLWGQEGVDLLTAGPGEDLLWGGRDPDVLISSSPSDTLIADQTDRCWTADLIVPCG